MKTAKKIAGFGLAAGAAVMIALAAPATARGPGGAAGGFGGRGMDGTLGAGPRGGVFTLQFADLDTDGDGFVTEAELTARAETLAADRLAGIDTDGDGIVTVEELEARIVARIGERGDWAMGKRAEARDPAEIAEAIVERVLSGRDTDGDGALSGAELSPAADMAALVDRFDTDDDNAWDATEFAQVSQARAGLFMTDRGGHGARDGTRR